MAFKLIADSCCDTTAEIREELDLDIVPLRIILASGTEYIDTVDLNVDELLTNMHKSPGVKTACPSIDDYAQLMYKYDECFLITLADFLSGSYNAAVTAKNLVTEEYPNKKIHVFNSLNACAGELKTVLFIHSLIKEGLSFEEIIRRGELFIENLATVFVLEDLSNLIKSGRMSKLTEKVASFLGIFPVLYKLRIREIRMGAKVRGHHNALNKMVKYIVEWTKRLPEKSITIVLSNCEAPHHAETVKNNILSSCPAVSEVLVVPSSGLSSVYANRGGIVISFETALVY